MTCVTPLDKLRVPLGGQEIELQQIDYEGGGMSLLRTRIREKSRFTVFEVDAQTAAGVGRALGRALGVKRRWALRDGCRAPPISMLDPALPAARPCSPRCTTTGRWRGLEAQGNAHAAAPGPMLDALAAARPPGQAWCMFAGEAGAAVGQRARAAGAARVARVDARARARALAGRTLVVAGHELQLGRRRARELLPHGAVCPFRRRGRG